MNLSSCGIDCDLCKFKLEASCSGCYTVKGQPFWSSEGSCDLYACANGKNLHDCGKCGEFPCGMLKEWANSEEGENGQRIKNLFAQNAAAL